MVSVSPPILTAPQRVSLEGKEPPRNCSTRGHRPPQVLGVNALDFFLQVEPAEEATPAVDANSGSDLDRVYLDLTPVKSFLHNTSEVQVQASLPAVQHLDDVAETLTVDPKPGTTPEEPCTESPGGQETQQVQTILPTGTQPPGQPLQS